MGLAVIHGIVKGCSGEITVYSEPGKGTVFYVFLPRVEGEPEVQTLVLEKAPTGRGEGILLVDDEPLLAMVEAQMLEGLGYKVVCRYDSKDALDTFRSKPHRYDLVITDLTMPALTGTQLAKEIKRIKADVPIIICSGFTDANAREKMKDYGVGDFVTKPIVRNELARVVRRVLDKKGEKK